MDLLIDGCLLDGEAIVREWQTVELSCLPPPGASLNLRLGEQDLEPFLRPGDPAWRWIWQAQGASGVFSLLLRAGWPDGQTVELRAALRVLPRKLDEDRYHALIDDLQRLGRHLVLALAGGGEDATLPPLPERPAPDEELHSLFGASFEPFVSAVERLARRPPEQLRPAQARVDPGQLRDLAGMRIDPGRDLISQPLTSGGAEAPADAAALVGRLASVIETRSVSGYDTSENRLLVRVLDGLRRRIDRALEIPGLSLGMRERGAAIVSRLRALRGLPFLAGIPPLAGFSGPSARMQRDPDYRAVYRMWQAMRRRPLISWTEPSLTLPIQELARLYESWCAVQLVLILAGLPGYTLIEQSLALSDDASEGWSLRLSEKVPLLSLRGPDTRTLSLHYQPRYRPLPADPERRVTPTGLYSLDRHTRVPDLTVELDRPGQPPLVLVLDAKYRLDASGGVPEDALADAYSYLGSIGTSSGARVAHAVALLYPGYGKPEIYPSMVAALPMLPGATSALEQWLIRSLGI